MVTEDQITPKNRGHYKFSHYEFRNGESVKCFIPKRTFHSEKEALFICRKINLNPNNFKKSVIYKCSTCGKWHIGHHTTPLTEKERNKIRKQIRIELGMI